MNVHGTETTQERVDRYRSMTPAWLVEELILRDFQLKTVLGREEQAKQAAAKRIEQANDERAEAVRAFRVLHRLKRQGRKQVRLSELGL